jgi:hypothetical protein
VQQTARQLMSRDSRESFLTVQPHTGGLSVKGTGAEPRILTSALSGLPSGSTPPPVRTAPLGQEAPLKPAEPAGIVVVLSRILQLRLAAGPGGPWGPCGPSGPLSALGPLDAR